MHTEIDTSPAVYAAMLAAVVLSTTAIYLITESVVASILANAIAFGVLALLYVEVQHHEIADRRALARFILDIRRPALGSVLLAFLVVAVGVGIRIGVGVVKSVLAPTQATATHSVTQASPPSGVQLLVIIGVVVVFGPLIEELVFRGLLQRLLTRHVGWVAAIAVTAGVFAVMHVPNYGGFGTPLAQLVVPLSVLAADAILWGWLYARSGNVAVPWVAHAGSNALALVLWVT